MSNVVVNRGAVDDRSSSFQMWHDMFGDVEYGKDVRVEHILELFGSQVLQRRLLKLSRSVIDENLELSQSFLCLRNNLLAILRVNLAT